MWDYFKQNAPYDISKEDFIDFLVDKTISIKENSTEFKIVSATENHLKQLKADFDHFSHLNEKKRLASSGVEWFLDNYYAIQEACELIQDDLPEDYFRKLPSVKVGRTLPRVYIIARELLLFQNFDILSNDLHEFLREYQKTIPLRMGELWALPLMLRLVLIEVLADTVGDLYESQDVDISTTTKLFSELEPDEIVARSIRTLLRFDRMDWKKLFESHSYVDKTLERDPAQVYREMDFETRDHYRKQVEKLAERSPYDEIYIARVVVDLAENSPNADGKYDHVGFFLIDEGEKELKSKINYKQDFSEKVGRLFFRKKTIFYLGGIGLITALVVIVLMLVSALFLETAWQIIVLGVLSFIPASSVAVNLINSLLTAFLAPQTLPKMNFREGIPKEFRTAVCIPVLLSTEEDIEFVLRQIELHYLANRDKNLGFVLLSDFADAPQETMPEDKVYLQDAVDGIDQLNSRYRSDRGRRPFYLFHRKRQWNVKEDSWIGWERKRGKLSDFNRYLIEGYKDSFDKIIGEEEFLKKVRFVITVDADTVLPRESASSLIATMAHPLNRAEFDQKTGRVHSGYTILQPRTEVKPTTVSKSLFTRIFAGDLGLDLYTRAVSDVYQDLFGEGIYVGKGIYDVEAFQRSIEGKAPDNALLSHDLFEGLLGRAALVSDVVFFEEYPPDYASYIERLHRWVRGDWQLLPWLLPKVPRRQGGYTSNPFKGIDLWKIFDNLRRSLLEISTLIAFLTGWLMFQKSAWIWTLLLLFISAFPLVNNVITTLSSRFLLGAKANLFSKIKSAFIRWIFWLVFLPYESLTMFDAIITTLVRVFISRKRLLQWQTSAHTIRLFGKQRKIAAIWHRMLGAPLLTLVFGLLIWLINQRALPISVPFLILWLLSPQIAYWISGPQKIHRESLSTSESEKLRLIARRTWLFFERFIGPEDHWLPPDHFQEDPKGMVAHRTSPTNIGLMLLSTASAYDFGYIGVLDFIYRMSYSFETIDGLEKYRGHLFNWYDTRSLNTLSPRYISTVDSGNYAMSLIGLYQTLKDLDQKPICSKVLFMGIYDSLVVFIDLVNSLDVENIKDDLNPLNTYCRKLKSEISREAWLDSQIMEMIEHFNEQLIEPMNLLIENILSSEIPVDKYVLEETRYWSDSIFQHHQNIQRQIKILAPWIKIWKNRPKFSNDQFSDLINSIFDEWQLDQLLSMRLSELPGLCRELIDTLEDFLTLDGHRWNGNSSEKEKQTFIDWLNAFMQDLKESLSHMEELNQKIDFLLSRIDFYLERMEFDFLFDKNREVFFLGYQVETGKLDNNHYDLLASEARTASLYAIAQNQVPRSHWLHMSRPFTTVSGSPTLVSWNGSMFEYIMPNLFTRTYPETLLHQTSQSVVQSQINYAKRNNVPWGISESSYYRFDQSNNYQYRGFGVPGLGRKRGLADDLVIAPYASLMAVTIQPKAVLDNLDFLKREGALGHFGFYESIDYTPVRMPMQKEKAVVKSYMAHHQGMIFIALANLLNPVSMVDRIHQDPRILSTELLLQEQIPQPHAIKETEEVQIIGQSTSGEGVSITPWSVDHNQPGKSVHVLTNGRLKLLTTESNSGFLEWEETALTRWRQDAAMDPWGIWFYVEDLDKNQFWSIGSQPIKTEYQEYRVFFAPHMTEIRSIKDELNVILQTTISPNDDICFQKITLTNQSDQERSIRLLSYGEVVLSAQAADQQHPAFNKMFIESSFHEASKMLFFRRRKRSSEETNCGMAHLIYDSIEGQLEYETDRKKFIGRNHGLVDPLVLLSNKKMSGTVGTTLDPIFSIGKRFEIDAKQSLTITYMTVAAKDEVRAKEIAGKYLDQTRIDNAFDAAQSGSEKLLRGLEINSKTLSKYQDLLSRVIYPIPTLRSEPEILNENVLGQSGLWSFGISGDFPILLVMIERQDEIDSLQETLLAHTYWRKSGMMIDLVILNTKDEGYAQELNDKIYQAINVTDSQNWVNRRGGIFVLVASQIEERKLILLKTAANAVIDLIAGNLEDHLRKAKMIDPHLPRFIPTNPEQDFSANQRISRPENLVMDNGIGGFTSDGKEYQIFLKDYPQSVREQGQTSPAPWINVISNEHFGFLISESGGGFTWSGNSGENRLTPWTNDPVSDPAGECLYLRDEVTGKIWSPMPYPSGAGTDYLIRHGQGYTIFESINQGFQQNLKLFVDPKAPVKIIALSLENQTDQTRRITSTYFAEWVLGSHRDKSSAFILPSFNHQSGSLMARNSYHPEYSDFVAFLTSNRAVHGITTDREEFLGTPGSRQHPAGLTRVGLSGKVQSGLDPCAALQTHINFMPGEKKRVIFILGQGPNLKEAQRLASEFSRSEKVDQSWSSVLDFWNDYLSTLQVKTPDLAMDVILNRWLPYQALSCRIWGRSAFYQSSGAYGFRDQLQDVMALVTSKPALSREHILRSAKHQFDAGDVLHWWHPPSGRGVRTRISDDLLWLVYVTSEYIRKTGDKSILEENAPFRIGKPLKEDEEERYSHYGLTDESYSLFEHCRRAVEYGDTQGPHGLPLIGSGDWNDGLNRVGIKGQGESVWLAWFVYENHKRFATLCNLMGETELSKQHQERADELRETIENVAWDDEWYLRAYYDDGSPLGSHRNRECQIDSLPQSWSVLTGGGSKERRQTAMRSVEELLVRKDERLIQLFQPPFDKTRKDPGYIKGYPPGIRENGGQYTHGAIWAVWALTELGFGDKAFDQFQYLNPVTHSLNLASANTYQVEPYVVAADIYSTPPYVGRGGWTWYTGSSGWLYRLGIEAILGFKLSGDHFTLDPCIPQEWAGFRITFTRDQTVYHIQVENSAHVDKGVKQVSLDGDVRPDGTIPIKPEDGDHHVLVTMG